MEKISYKYIIIGAGPAGLQVAKEMQENGDDYLVLEKGQRAGHFFEKYPKHRTLISINKVNTGETDPELQLRCDWNSQVDGPRFSSSSQDYFADAQRLVEYLGVWAEYYKLSIRYGSEVINISKDANNEFNVKCKNGVTYKCKVLVSATGFDREKTMADIPGKEFIVTYGNSELDKEKYRNKDVLILGKGNSALETANYLNTHTAHTIVASPNPIAFSWNTNYVGNLRAINVNHLDTYQLKAQNAVINGNLLSIKKMPNGRLLCEIAFKLGDVEGDFLEKFEVDDVISCVGFAFNSSIFDESIRPKICQNDKFPVMNADFECGNVKDLYFAGTLTHYLDFRKTMSGFIHGFRYNCQILHKYLKAKYNKQDSLKPALITEGLNAVAKKLLARANRSSGIFLQPGYIVDAFKFTSSGCNYYENLTQPYVHDFLFKGDDHYYTMGLEFGSYVPEAWNLIRVDKKNYFDHFVRPTIKRYNNGKLTFVHYLHEDFFLKWTSDNEKPLEEFFSKSLAIKNAYPVEHLETFEVSHDAKTTHKMISADLNHDLIPFTKEKKVFSGGWDNNVSSLYTGKLANSSKSWDMMINKVCGKSLTTNIEIYPVDSNDTLFKINLNYKVIPMGSNQSKVCIETTYASDLDKTVAEGILGHNKKVMKHLELSEVRPRL